MKELRVVEHYASFQGEGPNVGIPTHFCRFAGCSLKCPLWPCDSQHAIEPSIFMKPGGSYKRSPDQLVQDCIQMREQTGARNICLTGGEPFLQPNNLMDEFIKGLYLNDFIVEAFSNGTFVYTETALEYVQFMLDWKLQGTGDGDKFLKERNINVRQLRKGSGIKFVVKDTLDLHEAVEVWEAFKDEVNSGVDFWLGGAWGLIKESECADFILQNKLPWKLNVQVHQYVYPVNERGR